MKTFDIKKLSSSQLIILSFIGLIFIGTILLMLPIATADNTATSFIDALYIATSAVCVTGQTMFDTSIYWSYFGKTIIIILIEIGGLGFISLTYLFLIFLHKKVNLKQQLMIKESLNLDSLHDSKIMVKYVIKFTLIVQSIGAVLLSFKFIKMFGLIKGVYYGIFHSISAFNNAGFDLFGDSLAQFINSNYILLVIITLMSLGSLGFVVIRDVFNYPKSKKLHFNTKLVLISTITLISVYTFILFISEYNNFVHLNLSNRITNALFMATTPKTAGFYVLDYTQMSKAGLFLTLIIMFIGGNFGSIAGGVKITTVVILTLYVFKKIRNKRIVVDKKHIKREYIVKSVMIVTFATIIISVSTLILLFTESIPENFGIEYILFEVFSTFSTVGLTLGLSTHLTFIGKVVSILLMFLGRIGLLSFLLSVVHREVVKSDVKYPDAKIMMG